MSKIFYWSPYLSNVATINNVINSALSLSKYNKKFEVSIIDVFSEWSAKKDYLEKNNINLEKLDSFNLKLPIVGFFTSRFYLLLIFIKNFIPLLKLLKKKKPDFIIIHLLTSLPLIILLLFDFKTKFILRISGLPNLNIFRKLLWKLVSGKIFKVTCPSLETYNEIKKLKIFPEKKITILYDPIIKVSDIFNKKKQVLDKKYKHNFFLSIGRLTRQKNHILLLNSFLKQIKKDKNIILYIIGDGEKKTFLQNFIFKNNLKNNIFLLGYKDNVYPYIKNTRATIITSLWEDPGAVMIEAAFCNTQIISSNCKNGPSEFIMNNEAGYLFDNNNLNSLNNTINKFISDPKELKKKKLINAKKNSKNYTFFNHYKKLNLILND